MSSPLVAPPTAGEVTELLRAVMDPELGDNIVDLGMAGDGNRNEAHHQGLPVASAD
jgi:metal-sulfur cluster biosynthetic enzyme